MPRTVLAAVAALALAVGVHAAELSTLATIAVQGALPGLVADFQRETGNSVTVGWDTGPNIARRLLANETGDVIVAPVYVVDQAVRDGRVIADTRATIGQVGVGLAARRGARVPDIGSADALRRALLEADAIYFSQGTSGAHVASLFTRLGIAEQIKAKTTQEANGGVVMEKLIADSRNAVGFTMLSEIRLMVPKGATLVGPLPGDLQNYTPYTAAVMRTTKDEAAARAFVRFITSPAGLARFRDSGWQ
jgi:molybdate transport system substrate-binding protein